MGQGTMAMTDQPKSRCPYCGSRGRLPQVPAIPGPMPPESDLPCPQCGGTGWIPVEPDDPEAEAGRRRAQGARSLGAAQASVAGGVGASRRRQARCLRAWRAIPTDAAHAAAGQRPQLRKPWPPIAKPVPRSRARDRRRCRRCPAWSSRCQCCRPISRSRPPQNGRLPKLGSRNRSAHPLAKHLWLTTPKQP